MIRKILAFILAVLLISMMSFAVSAEEGTDSFDEVVELKAPFSLETPQNLTAELKYDEDNLPYFEIKLDIPQSVLEINANLSENDEYYKGIRCEEICIQFDYKVNDYDWNEGPSLYWNTSMWIEDYLDDGYFEYRPYSSYDDAGALNIEAQRYQFRAYFYTLWGPIGGWMNNEINSDLSNIVTIGNAAYYSGASDWAVPELDKAAEYDLIPDSIRDKMSAPITREEFAEVAVRLYEKMTGVKAEPVSPNPFTDTDNPEILKANKLGIIQGIGNNKFDPKSLTNREQVATMLGRAIRVMAPDVDFSIEGAPTFTDEEHISSWALEHVKFMSKLGIIKGADGKFMPKAVTPAEEAMGYATTTCEQAVIMSTRIYEIFRIE
ncbi:MAG TPA: S-layer homology domain-containing protein [Clostridiaceae bacterium]|nr:S-layer homology domain-containing protein [Clostridiaceae bacterium]